MNIKVGDPYQFMGCPTSKLEIVKGVIDVGPEMHIYSTRIDVKKPYVWLIEIWDGKNWRPQERVAKLKRKDAIADVKWWSDTVGDNYRVAKYQRVKE